MGMAVNTNLAAINSQRNLSNTQNDLSKSLEKLSSGLRINRAADDAAGLAISEGLRSQVNGYTVAARNAQDGISVIQTAEGALTEVHSILQRMRDLAVQAGNDSNNSASRDAIKKETDQLSQELGRIGKTTNFNGINLLDGTANLSFQIGAGSTDDNQIKVNLSSADLTELASTLTASKAGQQFEVKEFATGSGAPVGLAAAYSFTSTTDGGTKTVNVDLSAAGPYGSVDEFVAGLNGNADFSAIFSASVVKDTNGTGIGVIVTAKDGGTVAATDAAGDDAIGGFKNSTGVAVPSVGAGLDFSSAAGAARAIKAIDGHIQDISAIRADLGAVQNRFESSINSLNVGRENLTAAESRIRDVDMAAEMVKFTKANILSQAGTSMLAQANQSSQGVLSLLR